jgi:hypothetical protein
MIVKRLSSWVAIGAAMGLVALVGGCSTPEIAGAATRPGKFRYYSCEQLTKRGLEVVKREKELREQIQRAKQGPGGEVAIALAYQNEYNVALGDLQEIENVGAEKKCVLRHRPLSDQVVR